MTTDDDDDRIVEAITHLRSAMSLLNQFGAMQAAAHVATAIFCMPATGAPPSTSIEIFGQASYCGVKTADEMIA